MRNRRFPAVCCGALLTAALNSTTAEPPPATKPPGGPAVTNVVPAPRPNPAAKAEEERARPLREAMEARDQADLARAAFEREHRAGPLAKDAEEAFAQVVAAYEKSTDRPNSSSEVLQVIVYCHLRLAGAYQYVQQFDEAVAQAKKAVEISVGSPSEVEATFNLGLIYLQAKHDAPSALAAFKRAQELIPATMKDANEQAKWLAAVSEGIARCQP